MSDVPDRAGSSYDLLDPLTGAYSRATLNRRLGEEIDQACRRDTRLSVLLADLDHFKSVNDAFGHARGDAVLAELAGRLRSALRTSDVICRYGGDEFVAVLPDTAREQALALAERVIETVTSTQFSGNPPLSLSSSIGVAQFPADGSTPQELLERADLRLYEAKRRGRSRAAAKDPPTAASLAVDDCSRLIERDRAFQVVLRFIDDMPDARTGVLALCGAPGSGRSRMLAEIVRAAQLVGYTTLTVRATPNMRSTPLRALVQAATQQWGLPESFDPAGFAAELLRRVRSAECTGAVVAVDDLHNLDQDSQVLLEEILSAWDGPPCMVVYSTGSGGAYRIRPAAAGLPEVVELEPLTADGVAVWLRSVIGWEAPAEFRRWFHRETGGFPRHMARGLRYLLDRALVRRDGDIWSIGETVYEITLAERLGLRTTPPPGNLPATPTSLVGRANEINQIKGLVNRHRLVTLAGPGGIGKTRLALQVAIEESQRFPGGAWFVALSGLKSAELLPTAIGDALGFSFSAAGEHIEQLADYVREKELLLILDTMEHLVHGVDAVLRLRQAAPMLRVLATSREPLHVQEECVYQVCGLRVQDVGSASSTRSSAVQLFVERARTIRANFTISGEETSSVARICRLLDGVPLAIELAATWVRTLSCREIAQEVERGLDFLSTPLRDVPERHRSLRAVFETSWSMLHAAEKRAFARLSVFRGGFSRGAAKDVAGVDLHMLSSLIDKSLLRAAGPGRHEVLETLRQYAEEKLGEWPAEREMVRQGHSAYYTGFVGARAIELNGPRQKQVLAEIGEEIENVRAGWDLAVQQGDHELMNRFLGGLVTFYSSRGWVREEEAALRSACESLRQRAELGVEATLVLARILSALADACGQLAHYDRAADLFRDCLGFLDGVERESEDTEKLAALKMTRAVALSRLGWLHRLCGEPRPGRQRTEEALRLLDSLRGNAFVEPERVTEARARGLSNLGMIHWAQSEYQSAVVRFREAIDAYRSLGNSRGVAATSGNLGLVHQDLGEYSEAITLYEDALDTFADAGERRSIGILRCNLGTAYYTIGDYPRAIEHMRHYLAVSEELGDRRAIARASGNLGVVLHDRGEYEDAVVLYKRALQHSEDIGDRHTAAMLRSNLGVTYTRLGRHREARALLLQAREELDRIEDKVALIDVLISLCDLCLEDGSEPGAADDHARAALALSRESGAKGAEAKALLSLATVEARHAPTEAAARFSQAIRDLEALGQKKELAGALLEYGRLLRQTGAGGYREHLSRAADLYKKLRLRHKVQEVEAELASSAPDP